MGLGRTPRAVAAFAAIIAFAFGAFLVRSRDAPAQSAADAVKQFARGRGDSLVLDLTRLSRAQRLTVLTLPLTGRINVSDVATDETCAAGAVMIKRPVVSMLDRLVGSVTAANPGATLALSNGWRPAAVDREVGGSGSGPHVRGECQDVAFEIPGLTPRASAARVAATAYNIGIKGIAILNDSDRYLVHLDPVRTDPWYVEQIWQQVATRDGGKWATYYQGVDATQWGKPSGALVSADDITGEWMATSIISGKKVVNGAMKSGPLRITVYQKPDGHYGMRIPDDSLPEVTALWDATRQGPGSYVVRYRWPLKPPDKGVEEFEGTVAVKNGVALRNTTQTNAGYPGESTHVNARWVRVASGRRTLDPELSWKDNRLYSHGRPISKADDTVHNGQFIDPGLFDSRSYRESPPAFDSKGPAGR